MAHPVALPIQYLITLKGKPPLSLCCLIYSLHKGSGCRCTVRDRRYRSFGSLESPTRTFIQLGIRQKRLKSVPVAWEGQFRNCLSDGLALRKRVKNERSNIGAQCRKPGHRRRDHYRGRICSKFNGDIDGSGREKQGDQWNERLGDRFALQGHRSRKQRFINSLPVRSCSVDRTSEVTRSLESSTSSVFLETTPFCFRRGSLGSPHR